MGLGIVPRIFLAEFTGTFILCLVGIGSTLQGTDDAFGTENPAGPIAGGIGVFLGIYCAANISGGHVNPAVTMSFFVQKKLGKTWAENVKMLLVYCCAQVTAGFIAACIAALVYYDKFNPWKNKRPVRGTCLFATCPVEAYSNNEGCMLFDQIIGTWILCMTVQSVADARNNYGSIAPLIIGWSATGVGMSFGSGAGGAINPARDIGPRCMASFIWGTRSFVGWPDDNSYYFWWNPIIGPMIGGALAGMTYFFAISKHWPKEHEKKKSISSFTSDDTKL